MTITDRTAGALLGTATGDALGAGYEFTTPRPDVPVDMIGGGPFGFEPGEWTDDTAMMCAIVQAAVAHRLDTTAGLDAVAARFDDWYGSRPKDIGNQTGRVLAGRHRDAAAMWARAEATGPEQAGNGSLMRTAAVAAAFAADPAPDAMLTAADAISQLTHTGVDTHYACQIWSHAIWTAIRHGALPDMHDSVDAAVPDEGRARWHQWITAAETQLHPHFEHNNGWVVSALQTAWWGIHRTRTSSDHHYPAGHIFRALTAVVRAGHDTDTTAAIAGGLIGAVYGADHLPTDWVIGLHGWPGLDAAALRQLADQLVPEH